VTVKGGDTARLAIAIGPAHPTDSFVARVTLSVAADQRVFRAGPFPILSIGPGPSAPPLTEVDPAALGRVIDVEALPVLDRTVVVSSLEAYGVPVPTWLR